MVTVAVLVLLLGVCLLVVSVVSVLLHAGARRSRRLVARTPVTPLREVRPGRRRVAGAGTTAYGERGRFIGPVSGAECAWFRVEMVRRPARPRSAGEGGEDLLFREAAPAPAQLVDASGTAEIDPELLDLPQATPGPVLTELTCRAYGPEDLHKLPEFVPYQELRRGETLHVTEVRLAPDREAYGLVCVVRVGGRMMLTPAAGTRYTVFTTDTREQVHARLVASAASARRMARGFFLFGLLVAVVGALLTWWAVS